MVERNDPNLVELSKGTPMDDLEDREDTQNAMAG